MLHSNFSQANWEREYLPSPNPILTATTNSNTPTTNAAPAERNDGGDAPAATTRGAGRLPSKDLSNTHSGYIERSANKMKTTNDGSPTTTTTKGCQIYQNRHLNFSFHRNENRRNSTINSHQRAKTPIVTTGNNTDQTRNTNRNNTPTQTHKYDTSSYIA